MDPHRLIPGDSSLIENIVNYLKARGIFDEFRHECLADVDTKSSCQNLNQRVDGYASKFLATETWNSDLNKNELRNKLRRHIDESGMLAGGADHVVEQVINPKIHSFFLPKIIEVVHQYVREQTELLHKKNEKRSESINTTVDIADNVTPKTKSTVSDPIADILSFTQTKIKPSTTTTSQQKHTDLKKKKEEEMGGMTKKKEEEPQIKKKEDENATKKKEEEILSKKKEEEVLAKKKEEEALSKKKEEDALAKKKEEEALAKKKEEEALVKKKEEALIKKKEEDLAKKEEEEILTKKKEEALIKQKETLQQKEEILMKKKEEDYVVEKKNEEPLVILSKHQNSMAATEIKPQNDKERFKKDGKIKEADIFLDQSKKVKEDTKPEEKKVDQNSERNKVDESKDNLLIAKSNAVNKKDVEKNKHKLKTSDSIPKEQKKHKKETSEKSFGKHHKHKSNKSLKETVSFLKNSNPSKLFTKDEKQGHVSKSKNNISKISDSSNKKSSKSDKNDSKNLKQLDKHKSVKSNDLVKETSKSESPTSDKKVKSILYSSSQDSSQGSDQEKSSKKEKHKHFSKHTKKENSQNLSSSSASKHSLDKKHSSDSVLKKHKKDKNTNSEKRKDIISEITKISSRSNSSGSGSSVSDNAITLKENSVMQCEEKHRSYNKDKKKKQRKDCCHPPNIHLPPPPPPPPSSSVTCEFTSSAEMSSMDDTQSSHDSEETSSDDSLSDSEADVNLLDELEKMYKKKTAATVSENDFYDIFLYSSSSSDFEGYSTSLEKINSSVPDVEIDVSVSSVHTSDLSSYDDELSDGELGVYNEDEALVGKRLTLKKAQQLLQERAALRLCLNKDSRSRECFQDEVLERLNKDYEQKLSSFSSDDECVTEPKRSLRRERKLNPRYASNEYTSIFNSKKETFITKQTSPLKNTQSPISSPNNEGKHRKRLPVAEKTLTQVPDKQCFSSLKNQHVSDNSSVMRILNYEIRKELQGSEKIINVDYEVQKYSVSGRKSTSEDHSTQIPTLAEKTFSKANKKSCHEKEKTCENKVLLMPVSEISSLNNSSPLSHKVDSNKGEEQLFKENNKNLLLTELNLNPQSNSQLTINPHSVKRKMKIDENLPIKRPCSRNSVDSSSSEPAVNENNPLNSEMQNTVDDTIFIMCELKSSDMSEAAQSQFFGKQRTNSNGDRLLLHSHGKANSSERKAKDSNSNKEMGAS